MRRVFVRLSAILGCVIALGCAASEPAPPAASPEPAPPHYFIHTVRFPGESYAAIARWYTGEVQNWRRIADENADVPPGRVFIGQHVYIPFALVNRTDTLPKRAVPRARPQSRPDDGASPAAATVTPAPVATAAPAKLRTRDELLDELQR